MADFYAYWANKGATDKWPAALSLYDKASQLFPDNAVILNKWSLALIIKGDFDEARTKLDYTASIDPEWAETSFLSGLLLTMEGKNDDAMNKLTAPIRERPANLNYFIDLCIRLDYIYDMVSPLRDALETHIQKVPDDWICHAMLGTTSLICDDLDKGIDEFNTAMMLVPGNDAGDLFRAILKLSKLDQSPERDTLLPELDKLIDQSTWHFL
jgi:tetratricopeptide (TPR) repeat protein